MYRAAVLCVAFAAASAIAIEIRAAPPAASDILERSIGYHDPQGHWARSRFRLELNETRPDCTARVTRLAFDNAQGSFEIRTNRGTAEVEGRLRAGDCLLTLNGSTEPSDAERDKYGLTCERLDWLRNYYTYLWGLPMKLRDPGTRLHQETTGARFQQRQVWRVRVTYDEAVGSDTWYFYFDRQTSALVGYRFYHDEAQGDGEYIVLEGEIETEGMRVPSVRAWYTNAEDRYLGTDTLTSLEVRP